MGLALPHAGHGQVGALPGASGMAGCSPSMRSASAPSVAATGIGGTAGNGSAIVGIATATGSGSWGVSFNDRKHWPHHSASGLTNALHSGQRLASLVEAGGSIGPGYRPR